MNALSCASKSLSYEWIELESEVEQLDRPTEPAVRRFRSRLVAVAKEMGKFDLRLTYLESSRN